MLPRLHIPDTHRPVPRSRHDQPAIPREIDRIDLLLMSFKHRPNAFFGNVPNLTRGDAISPSSTNNPTLTLICLSSAPVANNLPSGLKHKLRIYRWSNLAAVSSMRTLGKGLACEGRGKREHTMSLHPSLYHKSARIDYTPSRGIYHLVRSERSIPRYMNDISSHTRTRKATHLSCSNVCTKFTSSRR